MNLKLSTILLLCTFPLLGSTPALTGVNPTPEVSISTDSIPSITINPDILAPFTTTVRSLGFMAGVTSVVYGLYQSSRKEAQASDKFKSFGFIGVGATAAAYCMQPSFSNYCKGILIASAGIGMSELVASYLQTQEFNKQRAITHLALTFGTPFCIGLATTLKFSPVK